VGLAFAAVGFSIGIDAGGKVSVPVLVVCGGALAFMAAWDAVAVWAVRSRSEAAVVALEVSCAVAFALPVAQVAAGENLFVKNKFSQIFFRFH
jgi:hypothetical protein